MVAVELLPERRCDRCTLAKQKEWGCDEPAKLPIKWDGEVITRCPRRAIKDDPEFYGELFSLYRAYGKGFLPEEGGLQSQPAVMIEGFRVIDAALDRCAAHRREEEALKKSRQTRSGK